MPNHQNLTRRSDEEPSTSVDAVFDVLSNETRRHVLYFVTRGAPRADVAAVGDFVHESSAGRSDRERVAIDLHHRHLPKLAEAGLIDYDERSATVVYRGDPLLESCLDHVAYRELEELSGFQ